MSPQDGIKSEAASQQGALESFDQLVANIHADQAQKFLHFDFAKTPDVEPQLGQRQQVSLVHCAKTRWRLVEVPAQ